MKTKTFLGLPILQQKIPNYKGGLFNFGGIALFSMIPTILILWLGFNEFQNPDNKTTFIHYTISALIGLVIQHIARVYSNKRVTTFYSHWSNGVFMVLLFIIGYLVASEKFGL